MLHSEVVKKLVLEVDDWSLDALVDYAKEGYRAWLLKQDPEELEREYEDVFGVPCKIEEDTDEIVELPDLYPEDTEVSDASKTG
jgi:hypothetical protein